MSLEAGTKALLDTGMRHHLPTIDILKDKFEGITYDAVEAAFVGYCYGDSTSGQVSF